MKFGPVPLDAAEGAILAHSVAVGARKLKKATRLGAAELNLLREAGIGEVVAAVLEAGDVLEDAAATHIASALQIDGIELRPASTGRVNLHAGHGGVFTVDAELVTAINAVDPSVTLATLANHSAVEAGRMVATVKIIPFAVHEGVLGCVEQICTGRNAMTVHAFRARSVALIQTTLPGMKQSILDKTAGITADRLQRLGSTIIRERRVAHDAASVAEAIAESKADAGMLLVFGASAMSDPDDVIPAAIRIAGGHVERVGMPVDPGNLLVMGELDGVPVLGAPGCARSPKLNGFDWVIERLVAGIPVRSEDVAAMGVGGLLMEIPTRPQPREPRPAKALSVGVVLLAAGRSSRMGGPNKLLSEFDGVPLVRRSAERVAASTAGRSVVVLGNQAQRMREALDGVDVEIAENQGFASGLASSLKAGARALGADFDGLLVALADMPQVETADIDRLIATFVSHGGWAVVRASDGTTRGNPVILPRQLARRIDELDGDTGARHLVETGGIEIIDVDIGPAARVDVDTREALAAAGGILRD